MGNFEFEWWNIKAKTLTGTYILEVKAKNKENAIKHFKNDFPDVVQYYWETLVLDRKGYQRRF